MIEGSRAGIVLTEVLLLSFAAAALVAAPAEEVLVQASLGFGGTVIADHPAPLTVRVENRSTRPFAGTIQVTERLAGLGPTLIERPVEVSPGVTRQVTLLVEVSESMEPWIRLASRDRRDFRGLGRDDREYRATGARAFDLPLPPPLVAARYEAKVLVLGGKGRQIREALAAPPEGRGFPAIILGRDHRVVNLTNMVPRVHLDHRPANIMTLDAGLAPDTWLAYSGVDLVLFTEPDLLEMQNPAQLQALSDWVEFGGRLVLLSAARPELLRDERLSPLLPARVGDAERVAYPKPDLTQADDWSVEGPLLAATPLPGARTPAEDAVFPILGPLLTPVVRSVGLGETALARFDPLAYDIGNPAELTVALEQATGAHLEWGGRSSAGDSPAGALDGSLLYHLLGNGNVLTPSPGLLILAGLLFLVLIGPIDYHVLKRLGRLSWSPWTLLLYTTLFSGLSLGATLILFAPDEQVNRLAILDFTERPDAGEAVSGFLYHGIYSPLGGRYVAELPGLQCFGQRVARPFERSIISMRTSGERDDRSEPQLFGGPGAQPAAFDLPFNALRVAAHRISGRPAGSVTVELTKTGGSSPTVMVRNGLATPLTSGVLFSSAWKPVDFGTISPGETAVRQIGSGKHIWNDTRCTAEFPQQADRNGSSGAPPASLVAALCVTSTTCWNEARSWAALRQARMTDLDGDPSPPPPAWDLSPFLGAEDAVFLAMTDALPFQDGLEDRPAGFTWVLVRRVMHIEP